MVTIHQQFIALMKAAHKRAVDLTTESPVKGSILRSAAYEVLSDAIAALPLDDLAGEPALGENEMVEADTTKGGNMDSKFFRDAADYLERHYPDCPSQIIIGLRDQATVEADSEHKLGDPTLPICGVYEMSPSSAVCILKAGHDGPHVYQKEG